MTIDERVITTPVNVLFIEDNPLDVELELEELRRAAIPVDYRVADDEATLQALLGEFSPDVVLCDLSLQGLSSTRAARMVRTAWPGTPIIIVTGSVTEQQAVIALQGGAADYVLKSNLQRLAVALLRALEDAEERKQHAERQHRVHRLSRIRDVLSGVNKAILRLRDEGELFREARRLAFEGALFKDVFAFTIAPETGRVKVETPVDTWESDELASWIQEAVDDLEHGTSALQTSLRTLRPAIFTDVAASDAPHARKIRESGAQAVASFPLVNEGRAIGSIVYTALERDYFDAEEVSLLTALSNNLAFAFSHFEEQRKVSRLSRIRDILSGVNEAIVRDRDRAKLFDAACRIAYDAGGFVNVFIVTVDPTTKEVTVPALAGRWLFARAEHEASLQQAMSASATLTTPLQIAFETRKPAVENDLHRRLDLPSYRALLDLGVSAVGVFPLFVEDELAGFMTFDTPETGYFDDEEIGLLTSLTNNISFALNSIRREERVARLSRIRDALSAVNAAIVRLRERNELCQEVCRIAVDAGGFMNVYVADFDSEQRECTLTAFLGRSGRSEAERSLRERLNETRRPPGMFETSLLSRQPAVKNTVTPEGGRGRRGVGAAGAFPLLIDERAIGALVVETDVAGYFNDEEVELLTTLANNLSFALDLLDKQRRVDYLSYYDALTLLPNRTLFYDRLGQDIAATKKAGKILALVLLDISRFSALNNTLGEHVGDDVLRRVAARLRESVEESRIARVAGDRFALCFPMIDDLRPVTDMVTEDGVQLFNAPLSLADRELRLMVRAGCAIFPNDAENAQALFQNAEAALLSAKANGTAYSFYAPELNARLAKQLDLETRLQRAIDERQFVLYYQPKTDLRENRCVGFEALIRWKDPERGIIAPGEFIPLLEETGLIINVGRWALSEAVRQYEEWVAEGLKPPHIAVNLSTVQLRQERLVDDVRSAVERFTGECGLDLEVTESMLMEQLDSAIAKLNTIRGFGVQLSLDDFGTGYSSLAYIHRLPLNALKIDRSFIVGMEDDPDKTSIVTTIISLAQAMRLKVIAEGVETNDQARLLQLLRCDQIQGYLIGRPEPPDAAARFIKPTPMP